MAIPLTLADLQAALMPILTSLRSIENGQVILIAKLYNSTLGRTEILRSVPKADGTPVTCAFPNCLEELIVAGNETLPSGGINTWNSAKSLELLREYDPGYETGDDIDEGSTRSRFRRLKVATAIGITRVQMNFGQMQL